MAFKYTSDPTYTNPYGIGAQEADVARSKKLIEERKANEAQLIAEQAKYSRQEQKQLEAEAAAAAAAAAPPSPRSPRSFEALACCGWADGPEDPHLDRGGG